MYNANTNEEKKKQVHLQDNNGDIVVCSLQQHLSFEGDDLALLCEVKEHAMSKRGLDRSPGESGARKDRKWLSKDVLAARRVPLSASKMLAQRSSSKSVPVPASA
jgi:hypothetical protein